MNLDDPISVLQGVGPKSSRILEGIGITTIEDLLFHVPIRYEDRSNIKKISELISNEPTAVTGTVEKIDNIFTRNGYRLTKAVVTDETGKLDVVWFNQHYIKKGIPVGSTINLYGKVDPKNTKPQFSSPEWELVKEDTTVNTDKTDILPIYGTTEGITSKWIKTRVYQVLEEINVDEYLPEDIIKTNDLLGYHAALYQIHKPSTFEVIDEAKKRLSFDELLRIHLRGMKTRADWESKENGHQIVITEQQKQKFIASLAFDLTDAQKRAIDEVTDDLSGTHPMNRLLQGDVGSGKTVVAAAAMYATNLSNFTTIYLAPTQILAQQHFSTLNKMFEPFDLTVELITSSTKPKVTKKNTLVVGTHAILHHLDMFENVGLIIVDEQHKFGVSQRSQIVDYYTSTGEGLAGSQTKLVPNLLTMTATPIPRSLALTFYGELDLSVIDEMPKGRKQVETWVIKENKRADSYGWIKKQMNETNSQMFVVCPFIEVSDFEELQNVKAAEEEFENIKNAFPEYKISLLHGRMKNDEKDMVLDSFRNEESQILVTTPVIEVGIDFPNANVIIIETPERFGLASLHQLRGRVGRGGAQAYCILIAGSNASESFSRLKHLENTYDGNQLAEIDMKIRGPGNIYGTEQHGFMSLKVADITDIDLIKSTKAAANELFTNVDKYPRIQALLESMVYIGDD